MGIDQVVAAVEADVIQRNAKLPGTAQLPCDVAFFEIAVQLFSVMTQEKATKAS